MKKTKFVKILFAALLLAGNLQAESFPWTPVYNEPAFVVDIPSNWDKDYQLEEYSVSVFFVRGEATIEVQSSLVDEEADLHQLMSEKAARLAARFGHIRLVSERASPYKKNMYEALWRVTLDGEVYLEKTAFVRSGHGLLRLSCLVPERNYNQYSVAFENAALSLQFTAAEPEAQPEYEIEPEIEPEPEPEPAPIDPAEQLKTIYLYNRPNNLNNWANTLLPAQNN